MNSIVELVVDAHGCAINLSDTALLETAARRAAAKVGAQVVKAATHQFQPYGATVCLILKESHLIISTWPEYQLAIVNIFLCNPSMDAEKCWESLAETLKPAHCRFHRVEHRLSEKVKAA